ncbi:hypothetical protein GmRootA79_16110 [Acidovorax sp. A79]|uniref:hypothetical protein n=1 Tax=Acidovorax sp. A79 TaxID=3056107 RepID=UPI0034E8FA4C
MSDDLNQEIKFSADAAGVKAGVSEIKRELGTIGPAAEKAGEAGSAGLNKIGAGGETAARKLDSVTKNMVSSLQRQVAAIESGGTATRAYQESIARLRGADLGALKPYLDQLDAAKRKAHEAAGANKTLEGSFGGLGAAAGLVRTAVASALAGLSVGAVSAFVHNIADGVDALNDIKDATGASIENISALEDVAVRTGASIDVVSTAMVKFNQVLGDAKPGSAQELALKAIGLSAKELRQLDPAEALRQTAVALAQFADDGNKARLVQELFGKSLKEVAPFLNDLAEKGALVGKVTAEQAAEAEKFNKQLAELRKNATDAARSLLSEMLPAMNAILAKMREGGARGAIDEFGDRLLDWGGNAQRKRIENLKRDIASLNEEASAITVDVFGVRGGLESQINGLNAQLQAAQQAYYRFNPSSGGGRGVVNPPVVDVPRESVGDLPNTAAIKAQADAARKAAEEQRKELEERAKLMAELSGLTGSFAEDWARLTKIFTDPSGLVNVKALTEAQAELLKKQPIVAATAKAEADARKHLVTVYQEQVAIQDELNAAYVADSKAREAGRAAVTDYVRGIEEGNQALQLEVAAMGMTEQARKTAIEQYRIELELKKQLEAIDKNSGFDAADREEQRARANAAAAQAKVDAATRVALEEDRRRAESIENSLTDALMRGFESGKEFASNFRDTLVNMFKTTVLRPVISFIVNPIAGVVNSVVSSGLSSLGIGGNLLSGGASMLGGLGGLGAVGTTAAGWVGSGVGALFGGTAGNAALGASLGLGAGSSAAAAAGAAAASGGAISGAGAGLGAFLGANAIPILGGAVFALTALAKATKGETRTGGQFGVAFDGAVVNNRRGQTYTYQGQQYDRDFSGGRRDALVDGQAYRLEGDPVANEQLIRDAVAGTASGINDMLKALGSAAVVTGFSAGLETSGKGRGGVFSGGTLSSGAAFGESGKGDNYAGTLYELTSTNSPDYETALKNFTLDLKQSTLQALQAATDIPKSIQEMLKDVDAEALTDESANALLTAINTQIAGVEQFRAALSNMGLDRFSDMAFDAAAAVAAASGGFENLGSNLSSYYENFYSESEKTANSARLIEEALAEVGLAMPTTNEGFRELVEGQMALGASGAEALAALLAVNDEFHALTEGAASAAEALGITTDGLASIISDSVRNASSKGEASEMASSAFEEQFYDGILNTMASTLSQGLMSAIVGPMLTSLVGGAVASGTALAAGGAAGASATAMGGAQAAGAMAAGGAQAAGAMAAGGAAVGAQVGDFLANAQGYINSFVAMLSNSGIRDSIGQIGELIGGVAGNLYEGMNTFFIESKALPAVSGGLSSAMGDAADSMKQLTDTIVEEVKRLRGLMVEDSPVLKDVLMAQFATATAQARAGDKEALAKLPQLSQALESVSQTTAVSAVELARMRGWLAGSLEETLKTRGVTVPKLAVGTNYVPQDMLALIHKGEAVVPERYNPAAGAQAPLLQVMQGPHQGGENALVDEVRGLRNEVALLREQNEELALDAQRLRLRAARAVERVEGLIAMQEGKT